MKKVLICGFGVIGKDIYDELKCNQIQISIYDKNLSESEYKIDEHYDFAFISVPTDNIDNRIDLSNIYDVSEKIDADIIVVRSTVIPGTVDDLKKRYNKRFVFSPEFTGATQHVNNDKSFIILGGNRKDTSEVAQLYELKYNGYLKVYQCEAKEAEMCKYMENSMLAAKVLFCGYFRKACDSLDIDYEMVRNLLLCDKRFSPSHTITYTGNLGYDSHCFNKDLPAISNMKGIDEDFHNFMENIIYFNSILRKDSE